MRIFELGWEDQPGIDTCSHAWWLYAVHPYPGGPITDVEKCSRCGVPRCARRSDDDLLCLDRRHHHGDHRFEDGTTVPLGA